MHPPPRPPAPARPCALPRPPGLGHHLPITRRRRRSASGRLHQPSFTPHSSPPRRRLQRPCWNPGDPAAPQQPEAGGRASGDTQAIGTSGWASPPTPALTRWPFSPGSPASPSKPRSPCGRTEAAQGQAQGHRPGSVMRPGPRDPAPGPYPLLLSPLVPGPPAGSPPTQKQQICAQTVTRAREIHLQPRGSRFDRLPVRAHAWAQRGPNRSSLPQTLPIGA